MKHWRENRLTGDKGKYMQVNTFLKSILKALDQPFWTLVKSYF